MRSGRLQEATEEENSKTSLEQMTPRGQTRGNRQDNSEVGGAHVLACRLQATSGERKKSHKQGRNIYRYR